jgi:hypothetical protein
MGALSLLNIYGKSIHYANLDHHSSLLLAHLILSHILQKDIDIPFTDVGEFLVQ